MSEDPNARKAMLDQLKTIRNSIFVLGGMADETAQMASEIPDRFESDVWREIARRHRVKAIELQGQYAALSAEYTARFESN
ncbi:hypothetical protein OKC48_15955 [Methylorubrum extorquens]|uniref:hypothetical protein n=1 Tax=Methylorubrum extorquens TaxID=408 RepID=UPI00223800B0|nr:hypothetical protein [Methylorubrum extorquens]UYW24769.1 hypothetical protein OKC48_15955 [Methylorubrum extorquens]